MALINQTSLIDSPYGLPF